MPLSDAQMKFYDTEKELSITEKMAFEYTEGRGTPTRAMQASYAGMEIKKMQSGKKRNGNRDLAAGVAGIAVTGM